MKKNVCKAILGLFLLLAVSIPQPAAAFDIFIENPYSQTMWTSLVYYEDAAGKWVTRGWYKIEANSTRHLEFPSSTQRTFLYLHAYTSEASWGGIGEDAIKRTVIKEGFKYYDGESCPPGGNRRQVSFDRLYMENESTGTFSWAP
ncbi:DUF1036 domain-containing protein [Sporomusa sp. KB1]|jgi:uncharacterized membrane protein|uniref:DUF1036 domain-containing protein n=1 Tax=Sporomusa sp. KB1 TaxID=943346 RepID=UPI0011A1AFFB|nr:DUF1036 domain-containing protein [Sporomusa sp. KB1]TWH48319.1 putative integral membrane protein [Sporomusa sp. KB1]